MAQITLRQRIYEIWKRLLAFLSQIKIKNNLLVDEKQGCRHLKTYGYMPICGVFELSMAPSLKQYNRALKDVHESTDSDMIFRCCSECLELRHQSHIPLSPLANLKDGKTDHPKDGEA